jgi:hypothetical protein
VLFQPDFDPIEPIIDRIKFRMHIAEPLGHVRMQRQDELGQVGHMIILPAAMVDNRIDFDKKQLEKAKKLPYHTAAPRKSRPGKMIAGFL